MKIEVKEEYKIVLQDMLYELSESRLEVCLVPSQIEEHAKDGRMIRVAYNKNPEWYSCLCSMNLKKKQRIRKKPQTSLKKEDIENIINNMIKNGSSKSKYAEYLLDIAIDRSKVMDELCPF